MRKALPIVIASMLAAMTAVAADQSWAGTISDSMCGTSHKKTAEHGTKNISDRDCTLACVKSGGSYVFVSNGKVYNISNQDYSGLERHAGHNVTLTGEMNGDTIKVSKIRMAGKQEGS